MAEQRTVTRVLRLAQLAPARYDPPRPIAAKGSDVSDRFQVRMPEGSEWYDLWHTHVDWRGEGNRRPEGRRVLLRLLFDAWGQVEAVAAGLSCPWQSWLVLDADDSSQDAVFLHTPNPNRNNFPYPFNGVAWGAAPPDWLAEFVEGKGMEVGSGEYDGATLYWVRRESAAG